MIKIEKPDNNTVKITIKSKDGICPFCDGSGWRTINQRGSGFADPISNVKISIKCEWCKGTGKRS